MSILHITTLIMNILSVCTIMILGILFCFESLLAAVVKYRREDSRINRLSASMRKKHMAMGIILTVAAVYHSIWSFWRHGLSFSLGALTGVCLLGVVGSYLMKSRLGDYWVVIHKSMALLFGMMLICHIVL